MTHAEQIFKAAVVIFRKNDGIFTRKQVREQIGVNRDTWMAGYTAIFQGMRDDHPGGAPEIDPKYKKVFHRVEHGKYRLSADGERLVGELRY